MTTDSKRTLKARVASPSSQKLKEEDVRCTLKHAGSMGDTRFQHKRQHVVQRCLLGRFVANTERHGLDSDQHFKEQHCQLKSGVVFLCFFLVVPALLKSNSASVLHPRSRGPRFFGTLQPEDPRET